MDSRKGKSTHTNPKSTRLKSKNRGGSSSQANPNRTQPNTQPVQQFNQFGAHGFAHISNQGQHGFAQFANEPAFEFPVQNDYSTFRLPPSPQYTNRQFSNDVSSEDEDEEHVPETQEEEVVVVPTKTRMKPRAWSPAEEEALAKSFVSVSLDPYKGDHQPSNSFWKKVLAEFNDRMGKDIGRTHHQLNSKWGDLQRKVACFAGIYHRRKSNMASGTNDEDVLNATHKEYLVKQKTKHAFNHFTAWEVLKPYPKWCSVETFEEMESSSSKRARTSESNNALPSFEAEFPIDLTDEQCEQHEPEAEPEPEPRARPKSPPRRKGKKSVETTSTEREEMIKVYSEFQNAKFKLKEDVAKARIAREEEARSFIQEQKRLLLENQKQKDLEFLLTPHDNYTGPLLQTVLDRKREIAEKWGWQF